MTEQMAIEEMKIMQKLNLTLENDEVFEMAIQALEEIQQYRAIGTVEEINAKLAELERWHKSEVNTKIKNVFANTSTSICHNCDHKDEYIEELEAEVEELQALKERLEQYEMAFDLLLKDDCKFAPQGWTGSIDDLYVGRKQYYFNKVNALRD